MRPSSTVTTFALVGVVISFFVYQQVYQRHWYVVKGLDRSSFDENHASFNPINIPTTFYHRGRLNEVVNKWIDEFRLFRLDPNQQHLDIDVNSIFGDSTVRVKTLADNCKWESTLCKPCFSTAAVDGCVAGCVSEIKAADIFNNTKYYATFAKLDSDVAEKLIDQLGFPESMKKTNIEHGFIGNFEKGILTAPIHANALTSSVAIQFVGSKTWLFFSNKDYIAQDGFGAVPAAPINLPRRAPSRPLNVYIYHSQPGDVLFFPESWAHIVWTHAGPNLMVNYRKFTFGNFFRYPIPWLTAIFNTFFLGELLPAAEATKSGTGAVQDKAVPEKKLNTHALNMMDTLCEEKDGSISFFDQQMLQFLHEAVANNTYGQ